MRGECHVHANAVTLAGTAVRVSNRQPKCGKRPNPYNARRGTSHRSVVRTRCEPVQQRRRQIRAHNPPVRSTPANVQQADRVNVVRVSSNRVINEPYANQGNVAWRSHISKCVQTRCGMLCVCCGGRAGGGAKGNGMNASGACLQTVVHERTVCASRESHGTARRPRNSQVGCSRRKNQREGISVAVNVSAWHCVLPEGRLRRGWR